MKFVCFPDWKLDNFQWDPYLFPYLDELFLAMVTALPRVQSFWGRPRSDHRSACP